MKKWLNRLYEKNELRFALVWIVIYCAANSFANPISEASVLTVLPRFYSTQFLQSCYLCGSRKRG